MHSSTFSSIALVASSFFATGVLAKPINNRAHITDEVIVIEEVIVYKYPDGEVKILEGEPIGTKIIPGAIPTTPPGNPGPEAMFKEKDKPNDSAAPAVPVKEAEVVPIVEASSTSAPKPATQSPPPLPPPEPIKEAPVVIPIPSSSTVGKRGVAYNDPSLLKLFANSAKVSWCYNWGGSTSPVPEPLEFVPMLWGLNQHANNWDKWAHEAIELGSKHLLGFNEPDHLEQANLSIQEAVQGWIKYMEPYAGIVKLGSPAVTNGNGNMGLTWLSNFMNACTSCTIDFVAIHWYNGGDGEAFKAHLEQAKEIAGGRPIWLTEFQAPGSPAEQLVWLAEILPWLDSQEFVQRYSYFMTAEGILISGGSLSELGKVYVS